ncbi:MAG: hypothetical protein JF885_03545 [Candidatus Dormibacteraeota bacterium]|nr:hypothetical protein [Candidatus Dormibacteraeota bacterium]MBJ7610872.1 hypothetical protein [Candidatus Dormibacteraeota bacterium]
MASPSAVAIVSCRVCGGDLPKYARLYCGRECKRRAEFVTRRLNRLGARSDALRLEIRALASRNGRGFSTYMLRNRLARLGELEDYSLRLAGTVGIAHVIQFGGREMNAKELEAQLRLEEQHHKITKEA